VPDPTAVRLRAGHTLTVTETALALVHDARRRGEPCRPPDWTPETYHLVESSKAVILDAVPFYRHGRDGGEVLSEEAGEALDRLRGVLPGLADPLQQQVSAPVADQVGEGTGEVAGPGDVRAGEPDLKESLVLASGGGVARSHDPRDDLAEAGHVGRTGSAVPARRAARGLRTACRLLR
jgi:hypothetical protein